MTTTAFDNFAMITLAEDASGMDIAEGSVGDLLVTFRRPARLRSTPGVEFLPAKVSDKGGKVLWEFKKDPDGRWDRAYLVEAEGEPVIAHVAMKKGLVTLVLPLADLPKIVRDSAWNGDEFPFRRSAAGNETAELKFRAARTLGMNAAFTAREMEVVPLLQKKWNRELDLACRNALAAKELARVQEAMRQGAESEEEKRAREEERLEALRRAKEEAAALNRYKQCPIPDTPLVAEVASPHPPVTAAAVAKGGVITPAVGVTVPLENRNGKTRGNSRHREPGTHKLGRGGQKNNVSHTARPDFVRVPEMRVREDGTIVEVKKTKKLPLVLPPEEQEKRRLANIAARAAARAARAAKKADRVAKRLAAKAAEKNKSGGDNKRKKKRG